MEKNKINYNDLSYDEKLACISLFPEEAKRDKDEDIRLEAYRALGFTDEAKRDEDEDIRLEAYRALGFTDEAKRDEYYLIRLEAYRALGYTDEAKRDEYYLIRLEAYRAWDLQRKQRKMKMKILEKKQRCILR